MARTAPTMPRLTVTDTAGLVQLSRNTILVAGGAAALMIETTTGMGSHATNESKETFLDLVRLRADQDSVYPAKRPIDIQLREANQYDPAFRQLWRAAVKTQREIDDNRRFGR